ncbi:protein kinase [Streptomyces sp. NPDC020802]|uniref:protein kinase domain-containing protein n=1 Tax=Streptomyces sp. NPDC020802 TaxID=3365094 RepID=UPI003797A6C7
MRPAGDRVPLGEAASSQPLCVGKYRLGRRVGSGGQGTVYEAYDPEGGRVALKLLHATEAEGSEAAQRLIKEVEATQRVAVACTARLIEAVVHGPRPHVVSEFIDGPTLRAAVDEHGPFRGEDLHRLALAVAVALCGIHDAQVVHRDLKPDNVLLGCSGPVVIDFGVARLLDLTATQPAGLAGTPAYTAPEVFDGKPAGPSADVFAWGATVLFAATGRDPFGGEHLGHTVSLVRGGRHDRSMLSEPLGSLVGAALDEDPVNRPSAMGLLYGLTSRPGGPCGQDGEVAVTEGTRQARLLRPPVGSSGPLLPLGDIAEHVFAGLSTAEQDSAREVFLRMVVPADDRTGVSDTVRTVALEELSDADSPGRAASVRGVLTAFTAAGLLTCGDGEASGVAVRNSALVVAWPRLRSWISDDREGLRIHRRLGEGARSWQGHGRKDDALVQGTELERTVEWSTTAPAHMRLSPLEQAYLATAQRVGRRRRAQRRRLTVTVLVLAFLAVVSATVAWNINTLSEERRTRLQREQIESAARRAASRAEALRRWDPLTARLLNVAAWQIAHLEETRSGLLAAATQPERDERVVPAGTAMLSDDTTTIAHARDGARIIVSDLATGRVKGTLSLRAKGFDSVFSRAVMNQDGSVIALPSEAGVRLWRPSSRSFGKEAYGTSESDPVEVSGDGGTVATSEGGELHVWDTTKDRRTIRVRVRSVGPSFVALSPDGRRLAVVRHDALELWDTRSGRRIGQPLLHTDGVDLLKFSPDSRLLGVAGGVADTVDSSRDWALGLWNARTGAAKEAAFSYTAHDVRGVRDIKFAFSPDSQFLAIAERETIWIKDIAREATAGRYELPVVDTPPSISFGRNSRLLHYVASTLADREHSAVRTIGWQSQATQYGTGPPRNATFSGDGSRLAVSRQSGRGTSRSFVELHDTVGGRVVGKPFTAAKGAKVSGISLSRDGRTLAVTGKGAVTVWDTERHRVRAVLHPGIGESNSSYYYESPVGVVLSADGRHVATHGPNSLRLWAVSNGLVTRSVPKVTGLPIAFAPDGATVITDEGEIVDTRTDIIRRPFHGSSTRRVAVSGNGHILAADEGDERVRLWDLARRRSIGVVASNWVSHGLLFGEPPVEMALSADGRTLVTAPQSGDPVELWDTSTLRKMGDPLLLRDQPSRLAFSARTGQLLTTSDGGSDDGKTPLLESYALAPQAIVKAVCTEASRTLSRQEWQTHIPNLPYRNICP